ncbi:MAG: DNA-directed RNA polymerase subunit beta' [Spirochaetes bacterium]|nr:DNA-directed RNA polymerase subunit beta' [Spirochaetota bacterium]
MSIFDNVKSISKMQIKLASPENIVQNSYGEVKKPETINYRTLKPERDGLFCEKIFGTTRDYECSCGKFKTRKYEGVVCDRCNVQVTDSKVRRYRCGHISLAAPVAHIWYYKTSPSKIALALDVKNKDLDSVLFHEKYIVIDPGDTDLKEKEILTEKEYEEALEKYGSSFKAQMGAEAVKELLAEIDIDYEVQNLRRAMIEKDKKADKKVLNRLELLEDFKKSGNKPEWMILEVVPVIPPDLRPMVQLDGGRFATSDLNDLYRRMIHRNNRLKKLLKMKAPEIIVKNEKRLLQDAVDCLFDNSRRKRAVKGPSNRPLKSISEILKGKQGRFRQNLLGKRVDYSGRSVIVVGPNLKIYQAGLPRKVALELFKPFVIAKLKSEYNYSIKKAKDAIEHGEKEVWDVLEIIVDKHPVLLNRAPTLHRLGFQAFEPKLIEGSAIQLPPLVCHAYNADFDGDQMAIHIPLSIEAQIECWILMLSAKNLLDPANGTPIAWPTKDMVLGMFYLTKEDPRLTKKKLKYFYNLDEIEYALEYDDIKINEQILYSFRGDWIKTSAGKVIFNSILPESVRYVNEPMSEKKLKNLISKIIVIEGIYLAGDTLDKIKELGFKYATRFGATIAVSDIIIPEEKHKIISKTEEKVKEFYDAKLKGTITEEERYNEVIKLWEKAKNKIQQKLKVTMEELDSGMNPLNMIVESGARGSITQIVQLAGMRGNMSTPSGKIIDIPIKSNFKEGLSVFEYFISTHGARKGLTDTALKTADAGYLTRKLVDIAQDVVITENDCGTINGTFIEAIKEGDEVKVPISTRIKGRFSQDKIYHPITNELILDVNEYITEEKANLIERLGVKKIKIRSVLTCESRYGVCQKCYGENLATGNIVDIGEAVGIIAAQSIGQPGTQLTMRTFHIGGIASSAAAEEAERIFSNPVYIEKIIGTVYRKENSKESVFLRDGQVLIREIYRDLTNLCASKVEVEDGSKVILDTILGYDENNKAVKSNHIGVVKKIDKHLYLLGDEVSIDAKTGSILYALENEIFPAETVLLESDMHNDITLAEEKGIIKFENVLINVNAKQVEGGHLKIAQLINDKKQPKLLICDEKTPDIALASYHLQSKAIVTVKENDKVSIGDIIIKLPKEKTTQEDIVSGLPKVTSLFEARKPKKKAILAQVDGIVKYGEAKRSKKVLLIEDDFGKIYEHLVPNFMNIKVREGDRVRAGTPLTDGDPDPYDVLAINGIFEFSAYLLNEIQKVYRDQGVNINDKHIAIIVRQMTKKVCIEEVGDTNFVLKQVVDREEFFEANEKIIKEGGVPAKASPALQGIKKAALGRSFLSSASFQETTKVLTNAAIKGEVDYLRGLKENVIIGQKIPAGTGMKNYQNIKIYEKEIGDIKFSIEDIFVNNDKGDFINESTRLS